MAVVARVGAVDRVLNCEESPEKEKDWREDDAIDAGVLDATATVPARLDLREGWWRVGNQQSTGSCVGWATADGALRWHFVKTGRIGKRERLSVRFQWMAAKEIDENIQRPTTFIEYAGTDLKAALKVAEKWGAVHDEVLPFRPERLYPGEWKDFYAIAARLRISAYYNLDRDLAKWRRWLATNGPVLTRLDADDTIKSPPNTGELKAYDSATAYGGHCVALVGYTPEMFIVRNSWGTTWGDNGFGYASNEYAEAAFTEAYGVVP